MSEPRQPGSGQEPENVSSQSSPEWAEFIDLLRSHRPSDLDQTTSDRIWRRVVTSSDELTALQALDQLDSRSLEPDPAVLDQIWRKVVAGSDELTALQALAQLEASLSDSSLEKFERIWQRSLQSPRLQARPAPSPSVWQRSRYRLAPVIGMLLVAVLLLLSLGGAAVAQALPTSPLYPLKRSAEEVRLQFTPRDVQDRFLLQLAERRQHEVDRLVAENASLEVVSNTIETMLSHLERAAVVATEAADEEAERELKRAQIVAAIALRLDALVQRAAGWPERYEETALQKLEAWQTEQPLEGDGVSQPEAPLLPSPPPALDEPILAPTPLAPVEPTPTATLNATQLVATIVARMTPSATPTPTLVAPFSLPSTATHTPTPLPAIQELTVTFTPVVVVTPGATPDTDAGPPWTTPTPPRAIATAVPTDTPTSMPAPTSTSTVSEPPRATPSPPRATPSPPRATPSPPRATPSPPRATPTPAPIDTPTWTPVPTNTPTAVPEDTPTWTPVPTDPPEEPWPPRATPSPPRATPSPPRATPSPPRATPHG